MTELVLRVDAVEFPKLQTLLCFCGLRYTALVLPDGIAVVKLRGDCAERALLAMLERSVQLALLDSPTVAPNPVHPSSSLAH
jgi:hypothetical protein